LDNISKAITIAGGVLISVLIISFCIYFLNAFREFSSSTYDAVSTRDAINFNNFFTNYSTQIYGYDVYNILGKVADINAQEDLNREIEVDYKQNGSTLFNTKDVEVIKNMRNSIFYFTENMHPYRIASDGSVVNNNSYKYSFEYDSLGYIYKVNFIKT